MRPHAHDETFAADTPVRGYKLNPLSRALHLLALWGFAVAQPMFDILSKYPEFFAVRGSGRWDILALTALLLLPALGIFLLIELGVRAVSSKVANAIDSFIIVVLTGTFFLIVLHRTEYAASTIFVGAGVAGLAFLLAYRLLRPVQQLMSILAFAPVVFVLLFLTVSPVARLVAVSAPSKAKSTGNVQTSIPVVVLVFDELPVTSLMDSAQNVDATKYPNFARFSQTSTWYRDTTTVADGTTRGVPAILTGQKPKNQQLPILSDHPYNLFSWLGNWYRIHADEPVTKMCPKSMCGSDAENFSKRMSGLQQDAMRIYPHLILPKSMEEKLAPVDQGWKGFGEAISVQESRRKAAEKFIGEIKTSDTPTVHFLHIEIPHYPFEYLPSGNSYPDASDPNLNGVHWGADKYYTQQNYQRHLLQVGYADLILGQMRDRLENQGLYDNALIVITADHGVSFRPNGYRRAPEFVEDVAPVPLFIKAPYQTTGSVDDSEVQTIDILPTIAAMLDTRLPWKADGQSLVDAHRDLNVRRGIWTDDTHWGKEHVTNIGADLVVKRQAALNRMLAMFGEEGIFDFGPYSELIGQSVSTLTVEYGSKDRTVDFDQRAFLQNVNKSSRSVPVFLTGRVRGAHASNNKIAIALNNEIVATTQTYRANHLARFTALIPETALNAGRNNPQFFLITESDGVTVLQTLIDDGDKTFRIVSKDGAESVASDEGIVANVTQAAHIGAVMESIVKDDTRTFNGWTLLASPTKAVDFVLVMADGQSVASGKTVVLTPEIVEQVNSKAARMAGFSIEVPKALLELADGTPRDVRVYAVTDGIASEVRFNCALKLTPTQTQTCIVVNE